MNFSRTGRYYCQCALYVMTALILVSCASSQIIESWHEPGVVRGSVQRIIVVAVMKDEMRRRVWEDLFIKNLSQKGVTVIPSYRIFPKSAPKEADLRDYVKDNTYAGILIVKKSGERKENYMVPGTSTVRVDSYPATTGGRYGSYGPYWGYYGQSYVVEQTPAHMETELIISYEASLWDASREGDGSLLWKGKSESVDPSSRQVMTEDLAEIFVARLQADGII